VCPLHSGIDGQIKQLKTSNAELRFQLIELAKGLRPKDTMRDDDADAALMEQAMAAITAPAAPPEGQEGGPVGPPVEVKSVEVQTFERGVKGAGPKKKALHGGEQEDPRDVMMELMKKETAEMMASMEAAEERAFAAEVQMDNAKEQYRSKFMQLRNEVHVRTSAEEALRHIVVSERANAARSHARETRYRQALALLEDWCLRLRSFSKQVASQRCFQEL
jgi:hypothetical protein